MTGEGLYAAKPWLRAQLAGAADALAARGVHPDWLTGAAIGTGLAGGAAIAAAASQPETLLLVPPLAATRIALNALDGMVAERWERMRMRLAAEIGLTRARRGEHGWGKLFNELGDRLTDLAFIGGLLFVPDVSAPLVAVALAFVLLSSHVGVLAEVAGARRLYGGVMGKADRMLWLSVAASAALVLGNLDYLRLLPALLLVGAAVTTAQRIGWARDDLQSAG